VLWELSTQAKSFQEISRIGGYAYLGEIRTLSYHEIRNQRKKIKDAHCFAGSSPPNFFFELVSEHPPYVIQSAFGIVRTAKRSLIILIIVIIYPIPVLPW
jgi:hypothetical protein